MRVRAFCPQNSHPGWKVFCTGRDGNSVWFDGLLKPLAPVLEKYCRATAVDNHPGIYALKSVPTLGALGRRKVSQQDVLEPVTGTYERESTQAPPSQPFSLPSNVETLQGTRSHARTSAVSPRDFEGLNTASREAVCRYDRSRLVRAIAGVPKARRRPWLPWSVRSSCTERAKPMLVSSLLLRNLQDGQRLRARGAARQRLSSGAKSDESRLHDEDVARKRIKTLRIGLRETCERNRSLSFRFWCPIKLPLKRSTTCSVLLQKMDIEFSGLLGRCGDRDVFLGFSAAADLVNLSFADVLDEATGAGYQRPFMREHSLEFKRYIQQPGATSIPLTFNLRSASPQRWHLEKGESRHATLHVDAEGGPVLAQVDGQHRLGFLQGSPVPLVFMAFLGLTVAEEMEVFRTINGKAKGLSGSLLDYTQARLLGEHLPLVRLDLYVALRLHEDPLSAWKDKLSLGGKKTIGMQRAASLRTMQTAVKRFVRAAGWKDVSNASEIASTAVEFWRAVAFVLPRQWAAPRAHVLVKGIGVYALMSLAGLFVAEALARGDSPNFDFFVSRLSDFVEQVDWSNDGPLRGYGGAAGADAALAMLVQTRAAAMNRFRTHA